MIVQTFDTFKAFYTELLAYEVVFRAVKETLGLMDIPQDLDRDLQEARNSPLIALTASEKYDPAQKRLLKAIDQRRVDEVVEELLQSWKPKGPPS